MASRGAASVLVSRASRMRQTLQSALEASAVEIEDVSYQHAGHAGVKGDANETHFNVKIVSPKFEGQSLVKRHRMVYALLDEELKTGLHAVSIVAKTPQESGSANVGLICGFLFKSIYDFAKVSLALSVEPFEHGMAYKYRLVFECLYSMVIDGLRYKVLEIRMEPSVVHISILSVPSLAL